MSISVLCIFAILKKVDSSLTLLDNDLDDSWKIIYPQLKDNLSNIEIDWQSYNDEKESSVKELKESLFQSINHFLSLSFYQISKIFLNFNVHLTFVNNYLFISILFILLPIFYFILLFIDLNISFYLLGTTPTIPSPLNSIKTKVNINYLNNTKNDFQFDHKLENCFSEPLCNIFTLKYV